MRAPDAPQLSASSDGEAALEITAPSGVEGEPLASEDEQELLESGTKAGRYMVIERVGAGGMGVVYAAFDDELDRKVALKVMHARADGGGQSSGSRERLLREAQAMAKLSHPNVITVHDVGTFDGRVFIAMEFIDGPTLRAWIEQGPHEHAEIVHAFVRAGRGLAAAHAVGLVHRDFKPDNVLIGRDGRVLVMDFGLARQASARPGEALPTTSARSAGRDLVLTRTGALVGTPAYMAPEQHRGAAADPLVDQFSFCVALYEALYGQRPFAGNSVASLALNVLEGHVRSPPRSTTVPAWLRPVVMRGLAHDPQDRYPSMDALLAELQADPPQSRSPWLVGAIGLGMVTAVAATYLVARTFAGDRCEATDDRLGASWGPTQRDGVRDAFSATELPFADTSGQTTVRMLDAWSQRWSQQWVDLCHAAPASSSLETLPGIRCLDVQRRELDALVERLRQADGPAVSQAVAAAAALPEPARCDAEARVLASADREPPASQDGRDRLEQLRGAAAQARALLRTGASSAAARVAEPLIKSAGALQDPGLAAEATLVLALALDAQGEPGRAEEHLREAVMRAASGQRPGLEAEVWLELVRVVGERLGLHDEAQLAALAAEAAIVRAHEPPELRPRLLALQAAVELDQGRYDDARVHLERAIERLEARDPVPEPALADAWQDLGTALEGLGRYEEAQPAYQEALTLREQLLGAQHPLVGVTLARLGGTMLGAELLLQADATFLRARWLLDPTHVTDDPEAKLPTQMLRWQRRELAAVLDRQGLLARAREEPDAAELLHRRALTLLEDALPASHRDLGYPLVNLGLSLTEQGRPGDALAHLRRAHEIWSAELDPEHPDLGIVSLDLANALWAQRDHAKAREHYAAALASWQALLPEDHPLLAYALTGLGRCELALGHSAAALESLERAYELRDHEEEDDSNVAETSLVLARALWAAGSDPNRARALVVRARDLVGAVEPVGDVAVQRLLAGEELPRFTDQLEPAGLGATNRTTNGGR
jgi:tetratricopeptide (TPR) repeat protein/predicted Ser/Thr protein kinase